MDVVATARGKYGGIVRERGDVFVIKTKSAFSERWMAKVNSEEGKAVMAQTGSSSTSEERASEIAAATGKSRDAEVAALEAEVAALKEKLAEAEDNPDKPGGKSEDDGNEAGGTASDDGETEADAEDAPKRKTRRRTRR